MTKRELKARIKQTKDNMSIIEVCYCGGRENDIAIDAGRWFKRVLEKHFDPHGPGSDIKSKVIRTDGDYFVVLHHGNRTVYKEDLDNYLLLDIYLNDWTGILFELSENQERREDFVGSLTDMGIATGEEILDALGR